MEGEIKDLLYVVSKRSYKHTLTVTFIAENLKISYNMKKSDERCQLEKIYDHNVSLQISTSEHFRHFQVQMHHQCFVVMGSPPRYNDKYSWKITQVQ